MTWLNDSGSSPAELACETGITETTLYTWCKTARKSGAMMPRGGRQQADEWDSTSRFVVVPETATLSEVELAQYCQSKGLYVKQERAWRYRQ